MPYRESKLTRILQDSLGGAQSRILMITCLVWSFYWVLVLHDCPFFPTFFMTVLVFTIIFSIQNSSFCQDSVYMANLAARSCQVSKPVASDAIRKIKSSTNSMVHSSLRNQVPKSVFTTAKKQTISRSSFSEKKANVSTISSAMKGRYEVKTNIYQLKLNHALISEWIYGCLLICIISFYSQLVGICLMMQQIIWEIWTRYLSSFVAKILCNRIVAYHLFWYCVIEYDMNGGNLKEVDSIEEILEPQLIWWLKNLTISKILTTLSNINLPTISNLKLQQSGMLNCRIHFSS